MKYLFITLEVQDGEHRHTHRILHTTRCKNIQFAAQRYASTFWGVGERTDNWWYVQSGTMAIRVAHVNEITEYEYKVMSAIFSGDKYKTYFKIKKAGYDLELEREEIQIHAGEHGNVFLIKTDEGFVVDVYNQSENVNTMAIWEAEDLTPEDDNPENFSMAEIEDYVEEWGQTNDEICSELGYDEDDDGTDEMLIGDGYFWLEKYQKWFPKCNSLYSEREDKISEYIQTIYC